MPVHLKWPNDIYTKIDGDLRKIGGILVTTEFDSDSLTFNATIGCGLNILNSKPSTCLQDLTDIPLELESIFASILSEFQVLYEELNDQPSNDCFAIFRDRYYKYWLHTNQAVCVKDKNGNVDDMIIRGLDSDGYLKAKSVNDGSFVSLQPDGNTFDMLKNLISVKQNV